MTSNHMLRQGGIPPNPSMLGLNPSFMQNPQQSGQQPLPQSHMGLPPGAANANAPMGMLSNNPQNAARFLSMQQTQPPPQQGRMQMIRQAPGGQHIGSPAAPQLGGIGSNQLFPQANMQQAGPNLGPRRGPPQPQPLNAPPGHMSPNNINLGMNPQNPMQAHMRQGQQQNPQGIQPPMSGVPDMALIMSRQGSNGNNHMTRTGSAMGALNSSSQVTFPPGMQTSHPQNSLQNTPQIPPNQLPISSPRPGSHPQSHNSSMPMSTLGPSQAPVNRTQRTPDNTMLHIGFPNPNSQFPPGPSGSRMPNNGQFPFTSSNSPMQMSDVPSPMPGSMTNTTGGTPTRATFQLTPAQQLERMSAPHDSFSSPFNLQPTRPPSQHNPHSSVPQQPPFQASLHQRSPRLSDPHTHAQRPASQPQQLIPGRPPSQSGLHPSQALMNVNATVTGRTPVAPGGTQPPRPTSGAGPAVVVPSRPTQPPIAPPGGPSGPAPSLPSSDGPSTNPIGIVPPQPNTIPQVGLGQGVLRLLQFSGTLANESPNKLHLSWWQECIKEYFTPTAIMKITLWKDNQRTEAKPFDIGVPILPRFFLVTTQSGVRSMSLALDGARERSYARNPHHCVIECPSAVWTYRYSNGYTVTLRGPLTAHIVISQPTMSTSESASTFHGGQRHLKFENLQFDADQHDKYILLDTVMRSRLSGSPRVRNEPVPTINGMAIQQQQQLDDERKWEEPRIMIERSLIPGEPVNAFGIPQATMRCLELAESVGQMSDLIVYSTEKGLGPLEALKKYATQIRESQNYGPFNSVPSTGNTGSNPPSTYTFITNTPNGPSSINSGGTLYSSAPPSVTNPQANPNTSTPSINSPQHMPSSASNSPQKQHQTIPQQQSSASSTAPAASPTVSSGATTNTPHMAHSNLKRKQTEVASPTISNPDQPPAKRSQRKRGRTAGGG